MVWFRVSLPLWSQALVLRLLPAQLILHLLHSCTLSSQPFLGALKMRGAGPTLKSQAITAVSRGVRLQVPADLLS